MSKHKSQIHLPVFDNGNFRKITLNDVGPIESDHVYVCFPGLLETASSFDEFTEQAASKHRVITLDYAGRGNSDKLAFSEQYKMSTCLIDICSTMAYVMGFEIRKKNKLSLKYSSEIIKKPKIHLIGNSMGGLLSVVFTSRYPDIPTSIVINDVGSLLPWSGLYALMGLIGRNLVLSPDGFIKLGTNELAKELKVDARLLRSVMKPAYADLPSEKNMHGLSFEKYFSKLNVPLLLVHSIDSALVNSTVLEVMTNMKMKPYIYPVDGERHPAPYTESVIKKILDFTENKSEKAEFLASNQNL